MKKYLAYRDVDPEGDAWSENSFLFQNEEDVANFFKEDNPDLIDIYTDEDDRQIFNFEVTKSNSGRISCVSFNTQYAGEVMIVEMYGGYLIKRINL